MSEPIVESAAVTTADAEEPSTTATSAGATAKLNFRPPPAITSTPDYQHVQPTWMAGSWYVTHSTLPMWKSNRNVKITYTQHTATPESFDSIVEYNPVGSDKHKTVSGVERADASIPNAWNWRGKGWLMIASSHWEVLGWGEEDDGWMVTFFQKTMFTPAGIDICVRKQSGVSDSTLEKIRNSIRQVKEDDAFAKLGETMFEVTHDL